MEADEYARVAEEEDRHWWYLATRALMGDLLGPWLAHDQLILDAGCGPGGNGAWLSRHGRVVGVDVSSDALGFVRRNRREVLPAYGDLQALPFRPETFDIAVGVTVLYHVHHDRVAAAEVARVLRPGGAALFVEPAFPLFRRGHDAVVHGRRRYRRHELAALVGDAGLAVRRATYAYSFLVPPAAALAALDRLRRGAPPTSDLSRTLFDTAFGRLALLERRVLERRDLPVGLSAVVLAEKQGSTRPALRRPSLRRHGASPVQEGGLCRPRGDDAELRVRRPDGVAR